MSQMSKMNQDMDALSSDTLLFEAREEINRIDTKMVELFEARMVASEQVSRYKLENGLPVYDPAREDLVISKNKALLKDSKFNPYYEDFIKHTISLSRRYQRRLANQGAVGFQGVEGSYSHIALKQLFGDTPTHSYKNFEGVFRALMDDEISLGVLPACNSYAGGVAEVLELLERYNCYTNETYPLRIAHCLLGVKGSTIDMVKTVVSHPQALTQCSQYTFSHGLRVVPVENTAVAAMQVANGNDPTVAAIASQETATLYGLTLLEDGISTDMDNTTTFVVVSKTGGNAGDEKRGRDFARELRESLAYEKAGHRND